MAEIVFSAFCQSSVLFDEPEKFPDFFGDQTKMTGAEEVRQKELLRLLFPSFS